MHYVKHAVMEAEKRGMKVILYDEAMYPSGSAMAWLLKIIQNMQHGRCGWKNTTQIQENANQIWQ